VAEICGLLVYYCGFNARRRALDQLKLIWQDEKNPRELRQIARQSFVNAAMTWLDALLLDRISRDNLRDWLHFDDEFMRANRVLDEGRGLLLLTAPLGNPELLSRAFGIMGYYGATLARGPSGPRQKYLIACREKQNVRTLASDSLHGEMLRVLDQNHILSMVSEQSQTAEESGIDFLGRPTDTTVLPVELALRSTSPIVPAFVLREGTRYRLVMEKPIYPESLKTREEAAQKYGQILSSIVERTIRQYPGQWPWMRVPANHTNVKMPLNPEEAKAPQMICGG